MCASSPSALSLCADLRELRLALIANWPALLTAMLGQPSRRSARHWRWNRRGSFSAVITGAKAGTWFDHEAGIGGGPLEFIARERGGDWRDAADWARHWLGMPAWERRGRAVAATPAQAAPPPLPERAEEWAAQRRLVAQRAATATWEHAGPVDLTQAYLQRKGVLPHGIRMEGLDVLIVPLVDIEGTLHTIQRIDADGTKRFLTGGAKAGHFAPIGGPLAGAATILLCEGWATGATAHEATGLPVVAAMDAGNLRAVALQLRARYPAATLILLADNDAKPNRISNPGVAAATAVARAVEGWLALPPEPGDFNDLALSQGLDAVRAVIAAAAPLPPLAPTYSRAVLSVAQARSVLEDELGRLIDAVALHWANLDAANEEDPDRPMVALPPLWAANQTMEQAAPC
ncbi:toprim domain-containing protein [Roseomonas sp. GC11]|uniref:toprim domain-containing protein n=1 Tax=Roseomonas sp. GC11 TaxID=2950546 RepID=UPI00210A2277|nr:toprim domain-containing protein [Roseomonas sp. GC11]MCQ4162163.1 toprim domain-containing protein [Roseomonas sp. GC11]